MIDVDTGASISRSSLRETVTTTVSPKLASCSASGAPETVTFSTVASENPASDTRSV